MAYSYNSKGQLTGIDGETSDYTLTYDAFGNVKTVKVGTTTLVTHTYGANNGNLLSSAYGNGFTVEYVYDSLDRVTKAKYNGTIQYEYVYNAMGQLAEYTDHRSEVSYTYYYDLIGRLLRTEGSDGTRCETSYDNVDKVTEASYTYNEDGIRTSKTANGITTEYFLSGSTILAEKTGENITWFLYDMEGNSIYAKQNAPFGRNAISPKWCVVLSLQLSGCMAVTQGNSTGIYFSEINLPPSIRTILARLYCFQSRHCPHRSQYDMNSLSRVTRHLGHM